VTELTSWARAHQAKAAGDHEGLAYSHGCGWLFAEPTTNLPVDTLADNVVDA
jgi:hypothetical protein